MYGEYRAYMAARTTWPSLHHHHLPTGGTTIVRPVPTLPAPTTSTLAPLSRGMRPTSVSPPAGVAARRSSPMSLARALAALAPGLALALAIAVLATMLARLAP